MIERQESGIMRVYKICKEYGIKEPVFKEVLQGFQVVLYKEKTDVTDNVTDNVTEKDTEKDTVKVVISKNQKVILEKIAGNNRITAEELVETVGINFT